MRLEIQLQPKQNEFLEAVEKYRVTFYGGAKGGGKSHGLRNILLYRRFKYPKTIGAIFRRSYPELEANIIRPLLAEHQVLQKYYRRSEHVLALPNGSFLEFNYCDNEKDLSRYQGREFHDLGIEEAGQWPEGWFQTLRGSNRSSIPGVSPRIALTGNPGGIGHKHLKRLFIDRNFNEREVPEHYHFIPARVWDNLALIENDPGYIDHLRAEPNEALRKAYLEGDWDIFAGQYFDEWRRDVHVLPSEFKIEPWWNRFFAYDHGFAHPAFFGAYAVDGDGSVVKYREWGGTRCRPDQIAAAIRETMGEDWAKVQASVIHAGLDAFAKQSDGGPSIAEQFLSLPAHLKMVLVPAKVDRLQGAQQLRTYLAWQNLPEWEEEVAGEKVKKRMKGPRLKVLETCYRTIECLPRMLHDDKRPEDVLKVDATDEDPWAGDDPFDETRYGIMSRPQISLMPREPVKETSYAWFKSRWKEAEKHKRQNNALVRRYSGR